MTAPLRIALAGLGTVGAGVVKLLDQQPRPDRAARRAADRGRRGQRARPAAATAAIDLSAFDWEDDATALAQRDDVDVVVELIGGADGPALTLARGAIAAGKSRGHRQQGDDRASRPGRWPPPPRPRASR